MSILRILRWQSWARERYDSESELLHAAIAMPAEIMQREVIILVAKEGH